MALIFIKVIESYLFVCFVFVFLGVFFWGGGVIFLLLWLFELVIIHVLIIKMIYNLCQVWWCYMYMNISICSPNFKRNF